ncbi:MAG: hypothetical protein KC621_03445 [Myxococcales bacterium]|nr:hypothetical protein [Myxococcales bacterium]
MSDHANVKGSKRDVTATEDFWEEASTLLGETGVVRGTIMNFPCLRQGTEFFGMPHHETGDAVLKLSRQRVAELVAEGVGRPFGPGGKVFAEWVLIPKAHRERWLELLREARAFVS